MGHMTLTVFSVCIQAAIGMMVFVALGFLWQKDDTYKTSISVAAGLGVIGMLASMMHLGQPFGAVKALNQFSTSWLSREIWFTSIFVALVIAAMIFIYMRPESRKTIAGLVYASAAVGLVNIFFMAAIYNKSSIPIWQLSTTFIEFYMAAISLGAILFILINKQGRLRQIAIIAMVVAVILQAVSVIPSLIAIGTSGSAAMQGSLSILHAMYIASVMKWLFILAGAVLCLWISRRELAPYSMGIIYGSTALLVTGQILGRYLFYASVVLPRVGLF